MSRAVVGLDRVVLVLLALVLGAASAGLAVWGLGRWPAAPEELDLAVLRGLPEHPWWPWALAVGGVLAVLLALRSLVAHARRERVRRITLGSGEQADGTVTGALRLDLAATARAAAEALARDEQVDSARGHVVVDRGATVVELVARVDAGVDLDALHAAVDRCRDQLSAVVGEGTAAIRVRLDVRRSRTENRRVA